jgi:hypothetical protein
MVTYPSVEWIQNSTTVDPSGHRHQHNTSFGYQKTLSTSPGGELDFGSVNIAISGQVSDTMLVYPRVSALGNASGIFNMKTFLVSIAAWSTGSYRFLERKTIHFNNGLRLTQADTDTPTVVPTAQNFNGTLAPNYVAGQPALSGIVDQDVGQYLYLAAFVDTNVPPGTYGGPGAGTFRYRLLYDFS